MANEAQRINNPDSTPGAVSTGYQLQNTHLVSKSQGLDLSVVTPGTGNCKLEISGPVDVNGEIYTINSAVTFTLSTAGKYYIHLAGSGANLTPTIGTGANTFDADKNARYTNTGTYRVLNWVIYYNGTTSFVHRLTNPYNADNDYGDVGSPEETWLTASGPWIAKRSKYYTFWMTGKGGDATVTGINKGSGGSSGTGQKRIFVIAGTVWTATFSTAEGGNLSFSDGTTTLTVANANFKVAGTVSSGMDNYMPGQNGSGDNQTVYSSYNVQGANSIYGGGGTWIISSSGTPTGGNATGYGSGGGYSQGSLGSGKQGVIRIIG